MINKTDSKNDYKKPLIIVNRQIEGGFPAAVAAAFPALTAGVVLGTQIKRALSDDRSLLTFKNLQPITSYR